MQVRARRRPAYRLMTERAARTRARPSPLLAIGILSAPEFVQRRMAVRASWLRWPEVTEGQVAARFAVRCLGAPVWLEQVLQAETSRYADVACLAVQHNETRVRGPVLMLAAWLAYAPRAFPSAQFIGKCDDDSYLHIPRLLRLLRAVRGPPLVYLGKMAWFHWLPGIFEHVGFGYERSLANNAGKHCRNASSSVARRFGTCEGPFPFAAGYLIVVSSLLAATLTASPGLQADVTRLARAPSLLKLNGKPQGAVMEDVWLGSIAYRYPLELGPLELGPVTYVTLGEGGSDDLTLISDTWGLRTTRTAMLVHVRSKAAERLIALHDFFRSPEQDCGASLRMDCPQKLQGCSSFVTKNERSQSAFFRRQYKAHPSNPKFQFKHLWWLTNGAKLDHKFCSGVYCRVALSTAMGSNCTLANGRPSLEQRNLLPTTCGEHVLRRAQAAIHDGKELLRRERLHMPPEVRDRLVAATEKRRPKPWMVCGSGSSAKSKSWGTARGSR